MKYNYNKANILWQDFIFYIDTRSLCDYEIQQNRRDFLNALTRDNSDKLTYINYLIDYIDDIKPVKNAKSRVYDFSMENDIINLINSIINFNN